MVANRFLSDAELERLANRLLARYEERYGPIACPPVPVESILEDVLDLSILWDTVDAENYIVANPDIVGESTQAIMKRAVQNCLARGDQEGYVLSRRWIIEHPVASRRELIEVRRKLSDPALRDLFDEAY